jgi:hypothetical protein
MRRETGDVEARPIPGPPARKGAMLAEWLPAQLGSNSDLTLDEHCEAFEDAFGVKVSRATMCRAIPRLAGGMINGSTGYLRRLDEYKETVGRLFPALPRDYVDAWSISNADALILGHFLECYPHKVIVLEIGTFIGLSAFHFASLPEVLRVIGVDPNPTIADEINDKSEVLGRSIDPEPLARIIHERLRKLLKERAISVGLDALIASCL